MDEQDEFIRHALIELGLPADAEHLQWMRSVAVKADWYPIRTVRYAKQEFGLAR